MVGHRPRRVSYSEVQRVLRALKIFLSAAWIYPLFAHAPHRPLPFPIVDNEVLSSNCAVSAIKKCTI